jgi:hypothetical protein
VARRAEGLTDEERGIFGLAVMTYLASKPTTPPELDPEHDVLDAVQARDASGFPGSSSLWWAVTEGRLRPYQERVTPSGRKTRTFTRAEEDRYLTEYGPPRSAR